MKKLLYGALVHLTCTGCVQPACFVGAGQRAMQGAVTRVNSVHERVALFMREV